MSGQSLPPVGYLAFPDKDGDCHTKYGHIAGDPTFVIKVAGRVRPGEITIADLTGIAAQDIAIATCALNAD